MSATRRAPREASQLVDALGDFLLFLQRERRLRRAKSRRKGDDDEARERKRRVLAWLRALNESEWASLCTVVDAGFVKTVLAMGMAARTAEAERARRRLGCALSAAAIVEFQLIPHDATARRALVATEPREFLRRPVSRTPDGDTLAGFHSPSFVDACGALMRSVWVLNSVRSCDTLAVSSLNATRAQLLARLDTISGGQFLLCRPSDQELQQPLWSQTSWFATRGYVALAELIVNQIEMNIWFHWNQSQKMSSYRIPIQGIASKQILAEEWAVATRQRQKQALRSVTSQVLVHLKQISAPTVKPTARASQLTTLMAILESWRAQHQGTLHPAAARMFAQQLSRVLETPQAAAVSLLVAELIQEECAAILSENLIAPTILTVSDNHSKSSHAQRRRAARKKMAKQRKYDNECRANHERLFRSVCAEIPRAAQAWQARIHSCVQEVVASLVDSVVHVLSPIQLARIPQPVGSEKQDDGSRPKRRKKRGKKKKKATQVDEAERTGGLVPVEEFEKENSFENARMAMLDENEGKFVQRSPDQPLMLKSEAPRPLLGFLGNPDDNNFQPTRPTPTFGPSAFYSASSPLYLQLSAHRDSPYNPSIDAVAEEYDSGDPTRSSGRAVLEPNFDWYLPPLFSSQSSVHTSSTVSSLDWDFQRWSTKTDAGTPARATATAYTSRNTRFRPLSRPPLATTSPVQNASTPVGAGEDSSSTDSSFPLASFANIIDISDDVSNKSDAFDVEALSVTNAATDESGLGRSDFLYREGGFFDRQRGPKRRRRPFPFEYDDDVDDCSTDGATGERSWEEERASTTSDRGRLSMRSSTSTNYSCDFKSGPGREDNDAAAQMQLLERVSKLESLLEDRTMSVVNESQPAPGEITNLQQQVALLSQRVASLENELQEVRRIQETHRSSPPPPQPPVAPTADLQQRANQDQQPPAFQTPMVPTVHGYPHPIMRPGGASNYSILGPFVSVPMSVLPPRSKLHWDMCEYVSQLQTDTNARRAAQTAAIRFCTSAVQSLWPRAQVRPYGSFVTRLALPSSDVDLVICLPKVRRDAPADAAGVLEGRNAIKESWQQNLARKLRQEPWVVSDSVKTIPHAAIPIISLVTTLPFNVRLDISFEGPGHNGLATNDVVLSLMHEFPPLAPIMLVLKSFMIERGFAAAYSGGLSSYALLLMVARYLQEHTDRYDHSATASTATSSSADFGMVLMGLLDFYGNRFEPRTTGISVAARCFFSRDSIVPSHQHGYASSMAIHSVDDTQDHWQQLHHSHLHSANLLSSPGSRRHNNRTGLHDWPMQRASTAVDMSVAAHDPHKFDPLFIEDPLHPSNNVGRNCFRITQIRRAFATGYEILMAASMSASVFSANRSSVIGGVALHPDNILRAILGPSSPAFTSAGGGGKNEPVPPTDHPPKPQRARYAPVPMPLYDQHHTPGSNGAYYNTAVVAAGMIPPYNLHRAHPHAQHQQLQQQYGNGKSQTTRPLDAGSYRRHSESVTEQMTTRSEAASSAAKYYVKRNKQADKSLALSPRLMPPAMHRSSSIELDKKSSGGGGTANANGSSRSLTRKYPSRSMSFADVVMSGGGAATVEHQRKAPSSPLALVRSTRSSDAFMDETISERLETKDDFELK